MPLAVMNVGGVGTITSQVPAGHMNWFGVGLIQIGTWYHLYLTVAGAQEYLLQRLRSEKNERVAMMCVFFAG